MTRNSPHHSPTTLGEDARLLIMKRPDWPEPDRAAWGALFAKGDIFDGTGPCAHWAEGSRSKRAQSYGHWLGFLTYSGRLDQPRDVTERAAPDAVRAFVENELARCSVETTYIHLDDLYVVVHAMNPAKDWTWLASIVERLRVRCHHGELKPRASVSASQISDWARRRMESAEDAVGISDMPRAVRFREGLMLGLLIARPLRVRTFIAIEIGRHLVAQADGFQLQFAPEDMKDKKAHDWAVPNHLVQPMQQYLATYRPILLQGANTARLWISRYGKALTIQGFTRQMAEITRRAFGETLRPHAFRHIAATSIAIEDPDHTNIIASVLGHATLQMAEKHYNRARRVEALSAYQDMVRTMRKDAAKTSRKQKRHRPHNTAVASAGAMDQSEA